jgi:UDP-N-acetylmuramate dehydrogenase
MCTTSTRRASLRACSQAAAPDAPAENARVTPIHMDLIDSLEQVADLDVDTNVPMSEHTSFRIGGPADLLVVPHTMEALASAVRLFREAGQKPVVIGNGTNLLVLDGGIRGVVVKIANGMSRVTVEDDLIIAESGVRMASLCSTCAHHGLGGLEWAAGIPGTLGGALMMNAGAHGGEIGPLTEWVKTVLPTGEFRTLQRQELTFGYRMSCFQGSPEVIVQAALRLVKDDPAVVHAKLCDIIETRCEKQPVAMPSAGCVFKRSPGEGAGRLVDWAGCKGMRVGGAVVSEKHANFIVNEGSATAADVLKLIEVVRAKVKERFDVDLKTEICILGEPAEE